LIYSPASLSLVGGGCLKKIYRDLDPSDQSKLIGVLRFAQFDAISSILSILDNQSFPDVQKEDFVLLHGEEKINGDLTDIYLEKEEEGREVRD
jgi:hypothetical protein